MARVERLRNLRSKNLRINSRMKSRPRKGLNPRRSTGRRRPLPRSKHLRRLSMPPLNRRRKRNPVRRREFLSGRRLRAVSGRSRSPHRRRRPLLRNRRHPYLPSPRRHPFGRVPAVRRCRPFRPLLRRSYLRPSKRLPRWPTRLLPSRGRRLRLPGLCRPRDPSPDRSCPDPVRHFLEDFRHRPRPLARPSRVPHRASGRLLRRDLYNILRHARPVREIM